MSHPQVITATEINSKADFEAAKAELVQRLYALPMNKQEWLHNIVTTKNINFTQLTILVMLAEQSDDNGKITDPAVVAFLNEALEPDQA